MSGPDAMRWAEFLATAQMSCSRCSGLPAVVHVYATARGAMCRRCLVEMPARELSELLALGRAQHSAAQDDKHRGPS